MEAPKPIVMMTPEDENDIKEIIFIDEAFNKKLDNENYLIKIGTLKEHLVIKIINKDNITKNYISFFTLEQLKNISKSMRYFDDINDIISFLINKGKNNEILLKKEKDKIYVEFKILSPNGKEDSVILEIKPKEVSDKELIENLIKKVNDLEKQVSKNREDIQYLMNEVEKLKKEKNEKIDSTITDYNKIKFLVDYFKETDEFKNKNIKFELLYRGTRDGDSTIDLHNKCDGLKNIIVLMQSEQGNIFGMYSKIGWETRDKGKFEYPFDDDCIIFTLNKNKIYKAIKGKCKVCWIDNTIGFWLYDSIGFYNNFLKEKGKFDIIYKSISRYFENCEIEDFNSGLQNFKFKEIEIFQIK